MADWTDESTEKQEVLEARRLEQVRANANRLEVEATGSCRWCGEDVEAPKRWCDAYCRDMWETYGK